METSLFLDLKSVILFSSLRKQAADFFCIVQYPYKQACNNTYFAFYVGVVLIARLSPTPTLA